MGKPEPSPLPELVPGLYDRVLTTALDERLDGRQAVLEPLDEAEAPDVLARHVGAELRRKLRALDLPRQIRLANDLLARLEAQPDPVCDPGRRLEAVLAPTALGDGGARPVRPGIPLGESALLVNARGAHTIGSEIVSEIESADRIDLVCSFLKWSGFRLVEGALRRFLEDRRRPLRVLTTSYTGATERRVLDRLVALGAEVRVSYDTRRTRLHAKAWLFERESGFSTAYIGSSNLSGAALVDGHEWNVRISAVELPAIVDAFRATFDSYWQDPEFERYDPATDAARFDRAVRDEQGTERAEVLCLDVRPYGFQEEILERLHAERILHGRWKNLVVAATGTGKTVIAAFDYKRTRPLLPTGSLLFVAHRAEILQQSRSVFRSVLRDPAFGELFVAGDRPQEGRHVFASVQSLARVDLARIPPDAWDAVVVDEFHHAEAPTYRRLLEHLRPRLLVGLTATPERTDGLPILHWFGDRIAAELRLWEALDKHLLCPFQYFGIADDTDLGRIPWRSGRYDVASLENLYTGDHARARLVAREVVDKVPDVAGMRALGFCASVAHAEFMADQFRRLGIPAVAVSGGSTPEARQGALQDLRGQPRPGVNVVFTVDLFNEGVDLPEVDTVLFLRPTESVTVFLQQLGRGLRLSDGKDCLTVLDFIGVQHRRFRFDLRYRALAGCTRGGLKQQVEQDFPFLPPGCAIRLEPVAKGRVLENLKNALKADVNAWVDEIRGLERPASLGRFLEVCDLDPEDLYRNDRSWTKLLRLAGQPVPDAGPDEERLLRGVGRLLHVDDPERLERLAGLLAGSRPPTLAALDPIERRELEMLTVPLWGRGDGVPQDLESSLARLWRYPAALREIGDLFRVLRDRLDHEVFDARLAGVPLKVHGRYGLDEILVAVGKADAAYGRSFREGVMKHDALRADLFFVTLQKAEKDYSPSTLYRDYALSPDLFHWESQSGTTADSPTGQRYRSHREQGGRILLFVRAAKKDARGQTTPYTFLGDCDYVRHVGERPMAIVWKLHRPMPGIAFAEAKAVG